MENTILQKQSPKNQIYLLKEKFCSLKEQVTQTKLVADQACFFCKQYNHIYELCPFYTLKHQKAVILERGKVSIPQVRQEQDRGKRDKYNCIQEAHDVRIHLKAVRLNYINNSMIDKETMVQLIESTLLSERDIDFYRNYDAFELRLKEDGLSTYVHLINQDKIAEEYFNIEDDTLDNNTEIQDSTHSLMSPPKHRTSISGVLLNQNVALQSAANAVLPTPITTTVVATNSTSSIEESRQKAPSLPQLAQYFQQKKSVSQLMTPNPNQNSQNSNLYQQQSNERYSLFKLNSFQNQRISQLLTNGRLSNQLPSSSNIDSSQKSQEDSLLKNIFFQMMKSQYKNEREAIENDSKSALKTEGLFSIDTFDEMKEYGRYFPKFNVTCVLNSYLKYTQKNIKGVFKKKRRSVQKQNITNSPGTNKRSRKIHQQQKDKSLFQQQQTYSSIRQGTQNIDNQDEIVQTNTFNNGNNSNNNLNKYSQFKVQKSQELSEFVTKQQSKLQGHNESPGQSIFKPQNEEVYSPSQVGNFSFY